MDASKAQMIAELEIEMMSDLYNRQVNIFMTAEMLLIAIEVKTVLNIVTAQF